MPNALIGILIKLLAVTFVVIIAILVKTYPDDIPISQIIFFRVALSIPFVIIFLAFRERGHIHEIRRKLTPNNHWLHIRRSFFGMTSMVLIFASLRLLPLPIANALKELSPIFITLLAAFFLGEKIRIYRTIGLLLGVFGVALISYQTVSNVLSQELGQYALWGAIMAISAAFTIALAQIQIRSMVSSEHPTAIVFWFFVITGIVSLCFAPFGWVLPSSQGWLWLIAIGFAGGGGQLAITIAYRFADASTIAPFEYFSIPLALLLGGLLFNEWPKALSLLGMVFILLGGLIIIYREGQIARQKRQTLN